MKNLLSILLILLVCVLAGCVKQKNCDCQPTVTGKFVYYEISMYIKTHQPQMSNY